MSSPGLLAACAALLLLLLLRYSAGHVLGQQGDTEAELAAGHVIWVQIPGEQGRDATQLRAQRGPCKCEDDVCSCCTGYILETFNQKACVNLAYDPDDFALSVRINMNDRTVYKNSISGKNPQPICVPIPRLTTLKMCLKFSNVFLVGRNIHACLEIDGMFRNSALFKMSLDCMRLGANGVALLKPEDGGGLAPELGAVDEDYDPLDGPDYDVEGVGSAENITDNGTVLSPVKVTTPRPVTPGVVIAAVTPVKSPTKRPVLVESLADNKSPAVPDNTTKLPEDRNDTVTANTVSPSHFSSLSGEASSTASLGTTTPSPPKKTRQPKS